MPTTSIYPDGESVTTSYTGQDWLAGLSTTQSGTTTTLLGNVRYSGVGGAAGAPTRASEGNGTYTYAASYDALLRPTDTELSRTSDGTTLFEQVPTYDAVGNVSGLATTLPQGTDTQAFCYDELNRLTWAGAFGTPPCSSIAIAAGTTTSATYDAERRLASWSTSSGTTGQEAYDGEGQRVAHQTTSGGGTTTMRYLEAVKDL